MSHQNDLQTGIANSQLSDNQISVPRIYLTMIILGILEFKIVHLW